MNLNDLITEVYLKIKRNLEYLRFHEEVKDLFKLLNNKFIVLQNSYDSSKQTNKKVTSEFDFGRCFFIKLI